MQYTSKLVYLILKSIILIYFFNLSKKKITRSLDHWSAGLSEGEASILNAYRDLIEKAEHFIYIEVNYLYLSISERSLT